MSTNTASSGRGHQGRLLTLWTPEDKSFWEREGEAVAKINLWISIPALFLAYLLALMVAQGRVASGIHTVSEAVLGALLGAVVTLLLYRLYCRVG